LSTNRRGSLRVFSDAKSFGEPRATTIIQIEFPRLLSVRIPAAISKYQAEAKGSAGDTKSTDAARSITTADSTSSPTSAATAATPATITPPPTTPFPTATATAAATTTDSANAPSVAPWPA
jgi:hypothetical protein